MRGGLARQTAQASTSVAANGSPQQVQPPRRNSIDRQQSTQKVCTSSTMAPHPEQRAGKAKSSIVRSGTAKARSKFTASLSPSVAPRTSVAVPKQLFDMHQRELRRDRAARLGSAQFLFERTFSDTLERVAIVKRRFRSALLLGCPDQSWPKRLRELVDRVTVVDPGPRFAQVAGGFHATEDLDRLGERDFDLCVAIGTLDTVNDLPLALANIAAALRSDSLLIGAISGGDTLPRLRTAMRAADAATGSATPHVHPRIDGPSLCGLLTNAGFLSPVVDVDRVQAAYSSLESLIADLRSMAATNILTDRPRTPFKRSAAGAASASFNAAGKQGRTVETFEILHFAGWTPAEQ